ncbi:hypothetical protein FNV43_RR22170 [Rhamnella rubrinervis]|uniref:Uncharacterized protein n=1 Tax=Rhamnella rubrinervis TaxID=2594499 RepID=A0A8K0DTS8_9ROSA|nr:hypothetical protein FNV43_RR22170 [Rhamnella rubrinervis]
MVLATVTKLELQHQMVTMAAVATRREILAAVAESAMAAAPAMLEMDRETFWTDQAAASVSPSDGEPLQPLKCCSSSHSTTKLSQSKWVRKYGDYKPYYHVCK